MIENGFPTASKGLQSRPGVPGLVFIVLLALLAVPAPEASAWFGTARDFPAGSRPAATLTGNFNSDANRDIAVARNTGEVSILLGNGAGRFGAPRTITVGGTPVSIASGKFDSDSFPDLAVADTTNSRVMILLGNGDGTFSAPTPFATGSFPDQVAVGLLDSDTAPDLAVSTNNGVSVLLGNGDGTFAAAVSYGSVTSPGGLAIGDLDADTDSDIAYTDRDSNTVKILNGNGDGTFAIGQTKPTVGTGPAQVSIGDLNRDLKPDLVTANFLSNSISLLIGRGDATFRNAKTFTVWTKNAWQVWPNALVLRDLNGDRVPDPAVTLYRANRIAVLLGNGEGSFARTRLFGVGSGPVGVAVGKLNVGQDPDLVVANRFSDDVSVLLNAGPDRRTVTLSWQRRNRKFTGTVKSSDPTCIRNQRVTILKRRPGTDRALAIAVTNRTGGFSFRTNARPGQYYGRVRAWSACRWARSAVVRVRSS